MKHNEDDRSFLLKAEPKLKELEAIRLAKLKIFGWRKKMAIPIATVITPILGYIDYWLFIIQRGNEEGVIGASAGGIALIWAWVTKPKRDYAKAYKTKLLPEIAGLFGEFTYNVKGKIPMKAMKPSKIVPRHSGYTSEDLFSGEYRGVGISFSEIKLAKQRGKRSKIVFNGLAVLLTHGTRKFQGHTILTKDQGKVGKWFKKQISNLKRANMVDPEFERLFDVYTSDQTEARYLIDPLIIESLKGLYQEYNGKRLFAAFYDKQVLIMIESPENHFEPAAITVPATNEEELLSMKREVAQIISIVDRLSLYDARQRRHDERANLAS